MINITFGQKIGKQGKPFVFASLQCKVCTWYFCKTDKATGLEQCSIGVARPVLHRRSACAFLLPPSLSSSKNWALRRPAAGAARSFSRQIKQQLHEEEPLPYGLHPPLLSCHHHQKPPVPPPPSETTNSTSTNSSTTRTTIISTNSKPSVTSSSLWAIYTCWHPMLDVPYSLLLSIECRKFTG